MFFFIYKYYMNTASSNLFPDTHLVLVAKNKIPVGAAISEKNTKWQEWSEKSLDRKRYIIKEFSKPDTFIGKIASDAFYSGDPITTESLTNTENIFSTKISSGKRAFSFMINKDFPILKYLGAGDIVDILSPAKGGEKSGGFLLKNIKILDVHDIFKNSLSASDDAQEKSKTVERQITVELSPEEIEKIMPFARSGALILSLHGRGAVSKIKVDVQKKHEITIIRSNKKEILNVLS